MWVDDELDFDPKKITWVRFLDPEGEQKSVAPDKIRYFPWGVLIEGLWDGRARLVLIPWGFVEKIEQLA